MSKEHINKKNSITFTFDNEDAKNHFIGWLCGQGEQEYWEWMRYREEEEDGNITATSFDYWGGTQDGKEFGKHDVIATCSRLDKDE